MAEQQMDRDEFIRLMIAELSSQKEADTDGFMQLKARSPLEIFRKMCFDYPDVTTAEMNVLGQAIEDLCFAIKSSGLPWSIISPFLIISTDLHNRVTSLIL